MLATQAFTPSIPIISTSEPFGMTILVSIVLADQISPATFTCPVPLSEEISSVTIAVFPIIVFEFVIVVSFFVYLLSNGFKLVTNENARRTRKSNPNKS